MEKIIKKKNSKGITLIALAVSIVILIIISAVIIVGVNNGLLSNIEETNFKTRMVKFKEDAVMYATDKMAGGESPDSINFGTVLRDLVQSETISDIDENNINNNIDIILTDINNEEKLYCVVYKGNLNYILREDIENADKQSKWCREIGIPVIELRISTGIANRDGDYQLVNGTYVCTPDLKDNFNEMTTRYFNLSSDGNRMFPGNFIKSKPSNDWYDYANKKWANICVEYGGVETYYVWIPRYCYKIVGEETDIRFINTDNTYTDATGNRTEWSILESNGYKIPDAFYWDENSNNVNDIGEELPGYWAMKYVVGEISDSATKTINYDISVSKGKLSVYNIVTDLSNANGKQIANYSIIINGNANNTTIIPADAINSTEILLNGLIAGENYVTVSVTDDNGEMIGSMTKTISYDEPNEPQLKSLINGSEQYVFNPDTTFYVTWDVNSEGDLVNENSDIPISQTIDKNKWYDYNEKRWANIVTRNNDSEIYYVWIPRYQYKFDSNETTAIKFINGTSSKTDEGYAIPDAFTFNDIPLKGYWAMKYVTQTQ